MIDRQLASQEELLEKGLVIEATVMTLRRERSQALGEIGRLTAAEGEARTRRSALDTEILKLGDRRREEAITRLRDLRFSEIELNERRLSLREQLQRLEVRAPVGGIVFESQVLAPRSVVRPADPILYMVPGDRPVEIVARIDPVHVDQIRPGQNGSLRFTTFDQRLTSEIFGTITRVSPDIVTDESSGLTYYEAIVRPDENQPVLASLDLRPGLPVEVYLKTEDRTPLTYLTKPLTDYFRRAFREE
ncbi:MAG: HlyD family efflux transporter periplasmic adaptor subunit [Pseudomonadota bacterium]